MCERENARKVDMDPLEVGSKAWYRRPEGTAGPLDTRWVGPVKIVSRVGEHSYTIEVKPGLIIGAVRSFLKPFMEDVWNGDPIPLHFHRRTILDDEALPDEFIVDKIVDHKMLANGRIKFKTLWVGHKDATWEPANSFVQRYAYDMIKYCKEHKVWFDLLETLSSKPLERKE